MVGIVSSLKTPVIAAYSIGQVILSIDHVIVFPLIRSTGIVVSQNLGAELYGRVRKAVASGTKILTSIVLVYIVFLVMFRNGFVGVFTKDPLVYHIASRMLVIFGPSIIGFDLLMIAGSIARASGHTLFMSFLQIIRLWALRIPLSWLLALYLVYMDKGLWSGMAVSNYVSGAIAVAWLFSWRWVKPVIKE